MRFVQDTPSHPLGALQIEAVVEHRRRAAGIDTVVERRRFDPGLRGIRIHRHIAEQPLADPRAAARFRVRAAALIGITPRHERVRANRQISGRRRFEQHFIGPCRHVDGAARPKRGAAAASRTSRVHRCRENRAVTWPTHDDREKSGVLPVISTLPMRSVWRCLTPVVTWPRTWWPSGIPRTRTSRCLRGAHRSIQPAQLRHERIEHVDVRVRAAARPSHRGSPLPSSSGM